jgi:Family of unknown function (DUF6861)
MNYYQPPIAMPAQQAKNISKTRTFKAILSLMMSVHSLTPPVSYGLILGAMLGAPLGGIGILPGALLGDMLITNASVLGMTVLSKWLLPKLLQLGEHYLNQTPWSQQKQVAPRPQAKILPFFRKQADHTTHAATVTSAAHTSIKPIV